MHAAGHLAVCVALGVGLFAVDRALARPEPIALDVAAGAASARAAGLGSDARAIAAFAASARDEALLAREARRRGLARGDAVVHETLARRAAFFLGSDEPPADRAEDALALGAGERDPVVRRRLATRLAARIRAEAAATAPSDAALRAWFEARRERWAEPARVRVAHVFFGGSRASERALRARAAIEADSLAPEAAVRLGDPHLLGAETGESDRARLVARWGAAFARAAFEAPVGAWSEPVESSHGVHLLFVRERSVAGAPDFEAVAGAVELAWRAERGDAALVAELARLRAEAAP